MAVLLAGGEDRQVAADPAPFQAAIEQYLTEKGMGMEVDEFRELTVAGDTAHAVCRMSEASDLHRVGVTWSFTFEKQQNGEWTVTERRTR